MNIEVFALCDAATDQVGKLNILGVIDYMLISKVPYVHTQCAVALRIRFNSVERGKHKVTVSFSDIDGKHIMPSANGVITIGENVDQRTVSTNLILGIQRLKIEKFGEYAIDLAVDNQQVASIPLYVKKRTVKKDSL